MSGFGAFLLLELFVASLLLSALGALVVKCWRAEEWRPRGLGDAERGAGVEGEWPFESETRLEADWRFEVDSEFEDDDRS